MSKVKPWQLGVIVVGLVVGVGSVVYSLANQESVDLNYTTTLVDVRDGQLYACDSRKVPLIIPARHPQTAKIALVRVYQENGKWHVADRDMSLLGNLEEDVKATAVNEQTGEVQVKSGNPLPYTLPKHLP